jgi:hypothetical protein
MQAHVSIQPGRRMATFLSTCVCGGAYAWWATGIRPFSRSADVAIAVPAALVLVAAWLKLAPRHAGTDRLKGALPWIALVVVAVGLEVAGLALGGRSRAVPTREATATRRCGRPVTRR